MKSSPYYLLTSLPSLPELGGTPPLTLDGLTEHLAESGRPTRLIRGLLLLDDLLQREAYLSGEAESVQPAVLSAEQVRGEAPLPAYLVPPVGDNPQEVFSGDRVWSAAYRHLAALAERESSAFLAQWIGHEAGLRNALAAARAKKLGLDEQEYLVAADLADDRNQFAAVLGEWSASANPLAASRALLRARWNWVNAHDGWFSFEDDELLAYAAKLMLLHDWRRLAGAQE